MATFISHSAAETEAFAEKVGRQTAPGALIGLVGDLGAGKTQFVKGFARGLGVVDEVLSPTFTLVHVYSSGRVPLYHLDLYRLERTEQIIAAGLDQYFAPEGIAIVEWWDRWQGPPPPDLRQFTLEAATETERRITY